MSHQLKTVMGIESFTVYEQAHKPGGVWHLK